MFAARQGPARMAGGSDPRLGYRFAVLNAVISGFAQFINSIGVKAFPDSTLYTTLKNGVVGIVLLLAVLLVRSRGRAPARLTFRQWTLLALIALVAGSVAYALDFRGRQISTAATAAVINHAEFLGVAALGALFLRERFSPAIPVALVVLAAGLAIGLKLRAVEVDAGVPFLVAGTALFAVGAILIKTALRTMSLATVVTAKMTLGSVLLFAYVAATGRLEPVLRLSLSQWGFVLVTGLLLLAFTLTAIAGLRHASATGVTAISAGAPIITTLLVAVTRRATVPPLQLLSMGLILTAVLTIYAVGCRDERRARDGRAHPPGIRLLPILGPVPVPSRREDAL
jgi:drug/metabolite transporter (DMT)-like permease